MMALLSPKVWLALALSAILAFAGLFLYRAGAASVRTQWDAAIIQQQAMASAQEADNRRLEAKRQTNVIEAQNAQTKRTQSMQITLANSRAAVDGLRNDLAAITTNLPGPAENASNIAASTIARLFDQCSTAYRDMAGAAQGHYSDTLTLQQAWPR